MATFLSKLFKPKWQSSNFETRKQALALLDSNKAEDLKILQQLAEKDPNPEVQQAAIQRIGDTETLIKLHKNAKDSLRSLLENRLYALASAQSLSIFDLIIDPDILCDIIIKAKQSDSFICGLARIEDSAALLKIAMQARNAQIRQAAAELIETETELNLLFAHAKNKDKTVYQIAKTKLAKLRALEQEHQVTQEKIEKLLNDLENLSQTEALQHFEVRLEHNLKQWPALNALLTDAQTTRFTELSERCTSKLKSLQVAPIEETAADPEANKKQAQDQETEQQSENEGELQSTIDTLYETLHRFKIKPAKTLEIASLDALIKTQENRWIEASREQDVSKSNQRAYQEGMSQLRHYFKALCAFQEHTEQITTLTQHLSEALSAKQVAEHAPVGELLQSRKTLGQVLNKLDWPKDFIKPDSLLAAEQVLTDSSTLKQQQAEQLKQSEQKIEQLIQSLDLALDEKNIKLATKKLKELQAQVKSLAKHQSNKFQAALSLRINQLNDLRDWQGFASAPKQEELCEAMERLAEMHIDPNDKADKIKAMQQQWKVLGGTGDKALWERFKTAADKAFEPCALFFAEQQQLKESNLKKREMLVEQLKSYLDNIDWQAVSSQAAQASWTHSDWKTADKINRQARQEWKEAFPIDFRAGKAIQQEFNQLIEAFDHHLEAEKTFNQGRKQAIVDQAKALLDQQETNEQDINQAIQQVKNLQEAWQKVGITQHKADRKLWTEYRAACDAIFARREQMRQAQRSEMDQAIADAEQTCSDIEASITSLHSLSEAEVHSLSSAHQKSLQALPKLPNSIHEKLSKRIEQVLNTLKQELTKREQQQRHATWQEVARKASLLRQLFSEVSAKQAPLDELKQDELDKAFQSQQTLPASMQTELDTHWQQVKTLQFADIELLDEEQARILCITCEIAAGIDSPEEDKALRMQLQVSRLSEGLSSGSENMSRISQLETTLERWYLALGLDQASLQKFEARIQQASEALLKV